MILAVHHQSFWNQHQGAIAFVALIVAVVFGLIAVAAIWFPRDTKTFDWELVVDQEIPCGPSGYGPPDLQVIYKDTPLQYPRLITLTLDNTGKKEIRADDFDGPVIVRVKDATILVSSCVTPDTMRTTPMTNTIEDGAAIEVDPVLYNRKDWSSVQLLVDGKDQSARNKDAVSVNAVIAGQTRPIGVTDRFKLRSRRLRWQFILFAIANSVSIMLTIFVAIRRH